MFGYLFKTARNIMLLWFVPAGFLIVLSGCGDFFEKKTTEIQTREILTELQKPREVQSITNPLPEMYRGKAKRVTIKDGVKVFYFTKHHTPDKLSNLVSRQLGNKVDISMSTNQMIIDCSDESQADKVLEFIEKIDVPPIQVNVDCLVLERFADVTMDWETTILIENLLGEDISLGAGKYPSPAFPGASLRESKRSTFGLDFGFIQSAAKDGHRLNLIVDTLISRGYLKILMNPQLETINGQQAKIVSRENAPLERILIKEGFDEPFSLTDYQWVEDSLQVTPHVFADGSIGLETTVKIGSKSKPEGVVQVSIITERSVEIKENRIAPGESLVIGGLRKSEKRSVIRGVPFFKDLPVIGVLFSSKDFEEKATEIIFILTPSISSGGVEYADIVDMVTKKHETPEYEAGLEEAITDPMGEAAYREKMKKQAKDAELDRRRAEIEKAEAREDVEQIKAELLELTEEVMSEKAKAAKALTEAKKEKAEAEKIKQEAEKTKKEAEEIKQELLKAKQQTEAAKKEAQKAKEAKQNNEEQNEEGNQEQ